MRNDCKSITLIGSGGKTSFLFALARRKSREGARVLMTTTTRMAQRAPFPIAETEGECMELLQKGTPVLLGRRILAGGVPKLGPADPRIWKRCAEYADLVLNEGDGSAGKPLKVPAPHEPALLPGTERIYLIAGLTGLYRPIQEACHRVFLVCDLLGKEPEAPVEEADLVRMLNQGYLSMLEQRYPGIPVEIFLNQADNEKLLNAADRLGARLNAPFQAVSIPLKERFPRETFAR